MHLHFRAGRVAGKTLGKRGDGLHGLQCSLLRIVVHGRDRRSQLIDRIGMMPVGMECKMPWSGTGNDIRRRRTMGSQGSLVGVVLVDHDLVQSQVGHNGKTVGSIEVHGVSVWPFLPLLIDAATVMLTESRCRSKLAMAGYRKHTDAAAGIIGRQDMLACFGYHEMAMPRASRGLLIQQGQISRLRVNGECADGPAGLSLEVVELSDRVKKLPRRMNRQKRGILRLGRQSPAC